MRGHPPHILQKLDRHDSDTRAPRLNPHFTTQGLLRVLIYKVEPSAVQDSGYAHHLGLECPEWDPGFAILSVGPRSEMLQFFMP